MRVVTILIIIAVAVGGYFVAQKMGWIGAAQQAATESFAAHEQAAAGLIASGKYEEAIGHLTDAIRENPNHPNAPAAMMRIGKCYRELGNAEEAIKYYEKTLEEYPNSNVEGQVRKALEQTRAMGAY